MVDGCRSKLVNVVSGVPQGSVLGPFLFLLYTSELFSISENKLMGYADDSTLIKVYTTTGIPTRVVGTYFCGKNLEAASNLSICVNFKVFSFVMAYNNKKVGEIFGCHITFCVQTQYL